MYSDLRTCDLMETNATYPGGQKKRDTVTSRYCLRCTSCDPSGKREVCLSDYCVHLGDTAVFIFSDNGTLRKTIPLTCSPRYLHLSTVSENPIFILCHPTSEGQSQYLELYDYTEGFPAPTTVPGGSLIFASGHDADFYRSDFMLYLRDNQINLEVHHDRSAPPRQLRSPSECDTLMKLHPRTARGNEIQFLLDCTTESNITKRFNVIENRPEGSSTFTEIHDTTGVPIDSPNGIYIAIVHNDSLTIYNASDLQQYPGTKTFAGRIQRIDFLSSSQLLVVVPGQNHTLVDIPVFVRSDSGGVAELPSTVAYCPSGGTCLPHKLLNRDILLVFTHNVSVYDALFYTTADPIQRLGAVQGIHERPQVAFFNSQPAVNTTPTLNSTSLSGTLPGPTPPRTDQFTPPSSSPSIPLPNSSPPTLPLTSSSQPTLPPASSPPTLPHPPPPTGSSEAMGNATNPTTSSGTKGETIFVIVIVVLVTVAFLAILGIVFIYLWKRKSNSQPNKAEYSKEEKMVMAYQQREEGNPRFPPTGGLSTQDLNLQTALTVPTNSPPTLVTPPDQTSEYSSAGSSPTPSSNHLQPQVSMPRPGSSCSMTSSSGVSSSERTSICDGASVQGEAAVLTHTDTADQQSHAIKYTAQVKDELVTGQNTSAVDLLRQKNDTL